MLPACQRAGWKSKINHSSTVESKVKRNAGPSAFQLPETTVKSDNIWRAYLVINSVSLRIFWTPLIQYLKLEDRLTDAFATTYLNQDVIWTFDFLPPKYNQVMNMVRWLFPVSFEIAQAVREICSQDLTLTEKTACCDLTFDLWNLIRSSVWAGEYFLSVLSKLFKPFTRYHGNNIWPDKWMNGGIINGCTGHQDSLKHAFADIVGGWKYKDTLHLPRV